jgi:hypothetical protein
MAGLQRPQPSSTASCRNTGATANAPEGLALLRAEMERTRSLVRKLSGLLARSIV